MHFKLGLPLVQICQFRTAEETDYVCLDTSHVLEVFNLNSGLHTGE